MSYDQIADQRRNRLRESQSRQDAEMKELQEEHQRRIKNITSTYAQEEARLNQQRGALERETGTLKRKIEEEKQRHEQRKVELREKQRHDEEKLQTEIEEIHQRNLRNNEAYHAEFRRRRQLMMDDQRSLQNANQNERHTRSTNEDLVSLIAKWDDVHDNYVNAKIHKDTVTSNTGQNNDDVYEIIVEHLREFGLRKTELDSQITSIMPKMGRIRNITHEDSWNHVERLLKKLKEPFTLLSNVRSQIHQKIVDEQNWRWLGEEVKEKLDVMQELQNANIELRITVLSLLTASDGHSYLKN